jgi:hypothetical protein
VQAVRNLSWFLFILSTGVLYVRPQEWFPDAAVQLFLPVVVPALLVSMGSIIDQLKGTSLRQRPITVCLLGVLLAGLLSDISNGDLEEASGFLDGFGRAVLFYLLLVGVVDTPARLRRLLSWLIIWDMVALIPIFLNFQGVISLPGIEFASTQYMDVETGRLDVVRRLSGTGLFGDANDICLNLSTVVIACLYRLSERQSGTRRFFWLLPLGFFGYCIKLTASRGGLLMVLSGLLMLILSRYRKSKALLLSLGLLLFCFMFVAGRQADISVKSGTGQKRIQIWKDGLVEMRRVPILGVGTGKYMTITNTVAHNSFVQAFVETGLVGGILFFGAVSYAFRTMYRLGSEGVSSLDPELRALRPYMMAVLVSYAVGMLSLTENYIVPTWVILGMCMTFIRLAATDPPLGGTQFDGPLVARMVLSSMLLLAVVFVFVQLNCDY